jgi:hypothetical protein
LQLLATSPVPKWSYVDPSSQFTEAGFSDDLPLLGLLGMRGFFEHFNIMFNPTARQVELDRLYRT